MTLMPEQETIGQTYCKTYQYISCQILLPNKNTNYQMKEKKTGFFLFKLKAFHITMFTYIS